MSATPAAVTCDLMQRLIDTWASISQNVIDKAVGQWRKRLRASMKAKRHHFEHLLTEAVTFQSQQQSTEVNTLFSVIFISQSVNETLDRPRVVAPSKTCGHVRSSRRRWRSAQCRPRSAAPTFGRVVLAGASTPA